ncbi:Exosome complex exonuclease rrp6 [Escovopsis weberi]|uniref:Exosome complex exonuclease rrp6 n=1 Tax=Escovopsis weberi TaxID=150374 RepID=A0A0M8MVE3_ESCWE|nr:Exosome complex exonuclease rrp6 [Escovopsis weberi]
MDSSQDFKSLQDAIQKSLVSTVKSVNRIAAEDLSFQRTVNPDAADQLDTKISRLLHLSTRLLQSSARACGVKAPTLEDSEDVEMSWNAVVDVVDSVLEKADTALDEYTGLINKKEPTTDQASKSKKPKSSAKVIRNANIKKPQLDFEVPPNNFPTGPWQPILIDKPHASVSLLDSLVTSAGDTGVAQFNHPYLEEISSMTYPERTYQPSEPIPSQPDDTTSAIWVDTYEGVLEMLEELKQAKEIAVDLEHHDFRTYNGLVSLMQISNRDKDWIVDTLRPWRHKLQVLNQVFADPSIIKVFHGAYMDMVWLQRDLGLYVNGLFDTFFACEALAYPARSLAFLLSKFVNFDADKQYQLADWRVRPIPDEMMYYARSDTHYLLYIYDCVRNDLLKSSQRGNPETDLIARVLERSRALALSRYEHPDCNDETGEGTRGWYGYVLRNSHLAFNSEQFAVFRAIWKWRDDTARKEDESPNYVLGNNAVADVSRANPPDAKALHSLLPLTAPLARARVNEIWSEIQREKSQNGPSLLHFFAARAPDSVQQRLAPPRTTSAPARLPEPGITVSSDRLPRSQLFGSMAISSQWDAAKQISIVSDESFPFPWQRYVEDGPNLVESAQIEQLRPVEELKVESSAAPAAALEIEPRDEEFTLKRGRKRKSEAVEEEEDEDEEEEEEDEDEEITPGGAESDEDMQDDGTGVIELEDKVPEKTQKELKREAKKARRLEKKQLKAERAERREAKLARKALEKEKKQASAEEEGKYQAMPFDYSKATSVLHAKRDGAIVPVVEGKKVFDPYSKSGDTDLRGARKMPPVRGEKSATFKK